MFEKKWKKVKDGLPKEDGWYITMTNSTGRTKGVLCQRLVTVTLRGETVRRWEWQGRSSCWLTTHWMELPEPPETEERKAK